MNELVYKPSSVIGNYLSRRTIADTLKPHFGIMCRANNLPVCVAANRVYMAADVSTRSVSSYLAFPSLPYNIRRFISVALSLRSPSAAVSRYPALCCSDFPHIFQCATARPTRYTILEYKTNCVNNFINRIENNN